MNLLACTSPSTKRILPRSYKRALPRKIVSCLKTEKGIPVFMSMTTMSTLARKKRSIKLALAGGHG